MPLEGHDAGVQRLLHAARTKKSLSLRGRGYVRWGSNIAYPAPSYCERLKYHVMMTSADVSPKFGLAKGLRSARDRAGASRLWKGRNAELPVNGHGANCALPSRVARVT